MSYHRSDIDRPEASIAWMIGGGRQDRANGIGEPSTGRIEAVSRLHEAARALRSSVGRVYRPSSGGHPASTAA